MLLFMGLDGEITGNAVSEATLSGVTLHPGIGPHKGPILEWS